MSKYLEVFKVSFKARLAWRFDVALNALFAVSRILLGYILWGAIFTGRQEVAGFAFPDMLGYYVLSTFFGQLDMSAPMGEEIAGAIKRGTFSGRMVTPCDVRGYYYSKALGESAFYMAFSLAFTLVWALAFRVDASLTLSAESLLSAFGLSALGLWFMLQLNFLIAIFAFKFTEVWVFMMIKNNIVEFISGGIIPLAILPAGLLGGMKLMPFYYVKYLPSMLLIGRGADEAATGFVVLLLWNAAMLMLTGLLYGRLRRRYDGVGI